MPPTGYFALQFIAAAPVQEAVSGKTPGGLTRQAFLTVD
jgi:hypothetical protein